MAFWKKIFKSKYTGAEIDAAVAKAGTVPAVTAADVGKALVVDEEGKIVPGEVVGGGVLVINNVDVLDANDDPITVIKGKSEAGGVVEEFPILSVLRADYTKLLQEQGFFVIKKYSEFDNETSFNVYSTLYVPAQVITIYPADSGNSKGNLRSDTTEFPTVDAPFEVRCLVYPEESVVYVIPSDIIITERT